MGKYPDCFPENFETEILPFASGFFRHLSLQESLFCLYVPKL